VRHKVRDRRRVQVRARVPVRARIIRVVVRLGFGLGFRV
jgi:hypothetical protein